MWDLFRDSTVGGFINHISNGKLLPYADQKPGYQLPELYTSGEKGASTPKDSIGSQPAPGEPYLAEATKGGRNSDAELANSRLSQITVASGNINFNIVDWDGPDDPDFPP